jgi:CubicO group peptidase (beta-lactamase class C family)
VSKSSIAVIRGVAVLCAVAAVAAQAAPITGSYVPELSGLDGVVTSWASKYGFQAVTVAIVKDKKLVYEKGFGYQDSGLTKEIHPSARMRLASNSILLTRRALRALVAEGKLASNALVYRLLNLTPVGGRYADSRMQQITVQNLIDDKSCLIDKAPTVRSIGDSMNLGRNATLAESIRYMWSQASTIRPSCVVGSTSSLSHYAMEIAAQIIAKTAHPTLDDSSPTAAGYWYGYYVDLHVGAPLGVSFTQANNRASEAWPTEIWYKSLYNCDPEWNRNRTSGQPQVSCAYSVDYFARPGSGTIVASAREMARYFTQYFTNGEVKPANLSGIAWQYVFYGTLPGTTSVTVDQVWPDGSSRTFVVLANQRYEGSAPDSSLDEITQSIMNYLDGVRSWPSNDLFVDYRIKNRWNNQYMQIRTPNGKVQYGSLDAASSFMKWQLQRTSDGYFRIMNRQTGDMVAIEHLYPWAEYLPNDSVWWSSQWTLQEAGSGFIRFINRWNNNGLHVEDLVGDVEHGWVEPYWLSAQWLLEAVP